MAGLFVAGSLATFNDFFHFFRDGFVMVQMGMGAARAEGKAGHNEGGDSVRARDRPSVAIAWRHSYMFIPHRLRGETRPAAGRRQPCLRQMIREPGASGSNPLRNQMSTPFATAYSTASL